MQQAGNLFFAELRQERFPRARGVHWQFAADRGRHSHQLCALYLIDDNRLMVAVIQHRQVHCFTGIFHQLAQNRVDDRQQVAALQEATTDDKRMGAHGPVS